MRFNLFCDHSITEINPLNTEFLLNDIYKLRSYLTGNTLHLRFKDKLVNSVYTPWTECRTLVC
jgi:hypothetical protein